MRLNVALSLLILLAGSDSLLASTDAKAPLKKVLAKYQKAPSVHAKLQKTVDMPLLGEKKSSNGQLYFSKGRFRLEMKDEEQTTVVLDGKNLWVATKLPEDFGGKWQVMKSSSHNLRKQNGLLAALFGNVRILDKMSLADVKESDGIHAFTLNPTKSAGLDIIELVISFKVETNLLESVRYSDEIGNQTTYVFQSSELQKEVPAEKFKYEPPKNSEVTKF